MLLSRLCFSYLENVSIKQQACPNLYLHAQTCRDPNTPWCGTAAGRGEKHLLEKVPANVHEIVGEAFHWLLAVLLGYCGQIPAMQRFKSRLLIFLYSVVWLMSLQMPQSPLCNSKELLCSMLAISCLLKPLGGWCTYPE